MRPALAQNLKEHYVFGSRGVRTAPCVVDEHAFVPLRWIREASASCGWIRVAVDLHGVVVRQQVVKSILNLQHVGELAQLAEVVPAVVNFAAEG